LDTQFYYDWAALEDKYWWFIARRRILEAAVKSLNLAPRSDILEIGSGTGGNLKLFSKYGNLFALESNDDAIALANKRGITEVLKGSLPDNIPYENNKFDLICLIDVLEHIDDDLGTLKNLHRLLKPGGKLLITAPAYKFLWSHQDEISQHKRRYIRSNLKNLISDAGFRVRYSTYFNTFFFPIVLTVRTFKSIARSLLGKSVYEGNDYNMPSEPVNRLMTAIFSLERHAISRIPLPFGVSIMVIAQQD
jgi:SAM-dependent methyltransferase